MGSAESVAAAMSSCVQLPSMAHEEDFLTFSGKGGGMGQTKLGNAVHMPKILLLSHFVCRHRKHFTSKPMVSTYLF